ncbi:Chitin synthase, class 7 [Phlyctochytrium bullatum]|nr:Chitin synthase, class 7 [Phlyctochytrium bullatum]
MTPFFYFYAASVIVDFFLLSGLIDSTAQYYKYFVSAHVALVLATAWSLFVNAFVGFQWMEDGTILSVFLVWGSSLLAGAAGFLVSLFTFNNSMGLSASKPMVLFIVYAIATVALVALYFLISFVLVIVAVSDKWPIFDLLVGLCFFAGGQAIQFLLGTRICDEVAHYIDGMLLGAIGTLLSVMMVYKFWDDITKEDFEFAVNDSINGWEVKEPLLGEERV